jgi:cytochrome P450
MYFGTKPFLLVTDLDMIREVTVKHFDKFVDRLDSDGGFKIRVDGKPYDGVFGTSGDEWRKRRHFISPAFSAHKMKLMEPLIKESTVRLAKKISGLSNEGQSVEVLNLYTKMTMEVIMSTHFGRSLDVQGGEGGQIYEDAKAVFAAFGGKGSVIIRILQFILISAPKLSPVITPVMRWCGFLESLPRLTDAARKIVEMRSKEGRDIARKDLLQLLIDAGDGDSKLSTGEIVADAVGFMLAGYETTSVALSFITYLLAKNPEAQEKLANEINDYFEENPDKSMYDATHEIDYVDMVVEESFRIYPPAPGIIRLCNEKCVINGISITPGVQVFVLTYNIHMNPDIFPEPEKFIPERFTPEQKAKRHPCAYLPFGFGPRNCVGMRFALMEAKMALIEIVRNFRIELSPETKEPLETELGSTMRPKHGVHVIFHSRE